MRISSFRSSDHSLNFKKYIIYIYASINIDVHRSLNLCYLQSRSNCICSYHNTNIYNFSVINNREIKWFYSSPNFGSIVLYNNKTYKSTSYWNSTVLRHCSYKYNLYGQNVCIAMKSIIFDQHTDARCLWRKYKNAQHNMEMKCCSSHTHTHTPHTHTHTHAHTPHTHTHAHTPHTHTHAHTYFDCILSFW